MRRILIVEDDEDLAAMLQILLEQAGARVRLARSMADVERLGPDGLAIDLALLDVHLGQGVPSGLDVQIWLLAHGFAGETVFLTGHAASHPAVLAAAARPHTRILAKPAALEDLVKLARGA
jgi:DNA-binding NtrC family response regulator